MTQARHGFDVRGLDVPRSVHPPVGRFGRLFPTLDVGFTFRRPLLDLDNLYGAGPAANPYLYSHDPNAHKAGELLRFADVVN
ncbi:MAG: hypothetical protein ACRDQX_05235 [Pseudonocardiaceae bacterium]